jgi:6-phosphogluconate dehydrogenase
MQVLAEAYDLLYRYVHLGLNEIHDVFADWNNGELNSFLMEIATKVLERYDSETKNPLVSVILDSAKQKGTGKWTSQSAMDLGVPTPTIDSAVSARNLSALKTERVAASNLINYRGASQPAGAGFVEQLQNAVQASIIVSYAQGFHLMRSASREYGYELPLVEIARIWKGGCIIRAKLLDSIKEAYMNNVHLSNLLIDSQSANILSRLEKNWREVVKAAKDHGIPIPAINASLDYFDGYRSERLPANFIQALRDYFGAHGYERIDREGHFHTDWAA